MNQNQNKETDKEEEPLVGEEEERQEKMRGWTEGGAASPPLTRLPVITARRGTFHRRTMSGAREAT